MTVLHFKRHYIQNICDADVIGINYRPDNLYVELQGMAKKEKITLLYMECNAHFQQHLIYPATERGEHSYYDYDKKLLRKCIKIMIVHEVRKMLFACKCTNSMRA